MLLYLSDGYMDVTLFSVIFSFLFKLYSCKVRFPLNLEGLSRVFWSLVFVITNFVVQGASFAGDLLFLSLSLWSSYFTTTCLLTEPDPHHVRLLWTFQAEDSHSLAPSTSSLLVLRQFYSCHFCLFSGSHVSQMVDILFLSHMLHRFPPLFYGRFLLPSHNPSFNFWQLYF